MIKSFYISSILLLIALLVISCKSDANRKLSTDVVQNPISATGDGDIKGLPMVKFASLEHDFGKVIQGEKVTYGFKFENTGKSDLLISNVSTACGCTVSRYPKEIVPPGGHDVIYVTFDSSGRKGFQSKTATVIANTQPNQTILKIKAQVVLPGD